MSRSGVVNYGVGFFLFAMNVEISKKLDRFVAHVDVKRLVLDNELGVESKHCLLKATVKEVMGDPVILGEDRRRGDGNGHLNLDWNLGEDLVRDLDLEVERNLGRDLGWNLGLDLAPNLDLDLGRNLGRN